MKTLLVRLPLILIAAAPFCAAQPAISGVVNAASYKPSLAPGTWAAIFGTSLAPGTATASSVPLATAIGGVSVTVGGIAAPLYYVSPTQINAVIPFEVKIPATGTVPVIVTSSIGTSSAFGITLTKDAPALFTVNGSGTGAALAYDVNFKSVSSIGASPIVLYATGLGVTSPAGSSASGGVSAAPFNTVVDPLTVLVGGTPAAIGFAGLAPGFPGIYQLNVTPGVPLDHNVRIDSGVCTATLTGDSCSSLVASSNTATIGASGGNVTNVAGTIDGVYPATGDNIALEGANPSGPGSSLGITLLPTGATFTLDFDVVANAGPFAVVATSEGGAAVINIDPAHGTWQGSLTSPTAEARNVNFSAMLPTQVLDFASCDSQGRCSPLPGNTLPFSRVDPVWFKALQSVPVPNTNATYN